MAFKTTVSIPQYKVPTVSFKSAGAVPRTNFVIATRNVFSTVATKLGSGLFGGSSAFSNLRRNRKGAN